MERSRGAAAQKRYREKIKEVNKTNAKFMACASEKAPDLVDRFFAELKVSNINENKAEITKVVSQF